MNNDWPFRRSNNDWLVKSARAFVGLGVSALTATMLALSNCENDDIRHGYINELEAMSWSSVYHVGLIWFIRNRYGFCAYYEDEMVLKNAQLDELARMINGEQLQLPVDNDRRR